MSEAKVDLSRIGLSLTSIFLVIWIVGFIFGKTQLFEWWWFLVLFVIELVVSIVVMGIAVKIIKK
jgi:phosphoglycerol transferase MdoB-like AlkP superfamily enzyme